MTRGTTAATAALLVAAAACQDAHHVEIVLGPDETTLSRGFTCLAEDNRLMLARGTFTVTDPSPPVTGTLSFQIVVDFIALGDGVPGCRGEEIGAWCSTHDCKPVFVPQRFCKTVSIPGIVPTQLLDPTELMAFRTRALPDIYAQLRADGDIIADAPDVPVIVRAVATDQPCAYLQAPIGADTYPPFETQLDSPSLMGCAYSCPVQLDQVDGAIELSLDGTGAKCEPEVRMCAGDLRPVN